MQAVGCTDVVTAGITVLLSMTVFQLVIMENFMPESSPFTPFIGTSVGAITFTVRVQNARLKNSKRKPQSRKMREQSEVII